MTRLLPITALLLTSHAAIAGDAEVKYRLTGLFQPDRVDDVRRQAGTLRINDPDAPAEVRLVNVNYETCVVTFAYDAKSRPFANKNQSQIQELINNLLQHATRGSFQVYPPSGLKPDQLTQECIAVAGLDCKGCAFGAYRAVAAIDGVERAVVSFKEGSVTVWINPSKTNRAAIVAALKGAQVDVLGPETDADKSDDKK
jgi:copper chaperone CopZ